MLSMGFWFRSETNYDKSYTVAGNNCGLNLSEGIKNNDSEPPPNFPGDYKHTWVVGLQFKPLPGTISVSA